MGEIFKLFGTIGIENAEAKKALQETEKQGETTTNKLKGFFDKLGTNIGKTFSGIGKKIDFKGIHKQFDTLGGKINSALVKGVQTGAKAVAVVGGVAMATAGATLVKSMNLAGELEQNLGGSVAVFEKYANEMQQTGVNAFKTMGLSQSDFLATANVMGSLFQGTGFTVKESMDMTSEAMQRASDVASIMGIDIDSAMQSVAGMAKGNFTMMDNLGVAINDTTIGNYALSKGIEKSTQEMSIQEKVGLANQLFLEKTAKYAGNYAKENDTLSGSLQTAKGALSNFMSGAGDIDAVVDSWMNFGSVAGKMAKELAPKLFKGLLQAIQTLVPKIPGIAADLAENFASVLAEMFGDGARDAFGVLYDTIVASIDGLKSAFDFIVKYKDIFTPIAVGIGAVVAGLSAYNAITKIATGIQTAFNIVLSANPIALVIMAITALVAGLTYFFTKTETGKEIWQKFMDFLVNTWNSIKETAVNVFTAVSEFFSTTWAAIKDFFVNTWNSIVEFMTPIIETIKNVITVGFMLIQSIIEGVITFVTSIIQAGWNIIQAVFQTVMNIIQSIIDAVWGAIGDKVMAVMTSIQNVISTVWSVISSVVSTVVNAIKDTVGVAWDWISSKTNAAFNTVKSVVSTIWNAIKSVISTVVENVKTVVSNVWNAISSITSSIFNAVKGVVTSVWDNIKSTISNVVNTVKNKVTEVWNGIKSTTSSVFNGIKDVATNVWNNIKSAMTAPVEAAKNTISGIIDKIKGFFSGLNLKLPEIKMPKLPHFSIKGSFSLTPPSVPKLSVDWYAKGGIMQKAMAFGMNGNNVMVGGEAGKEAILPLNEQTLGDIGKGIAGQMGYSQEAVVSKLDELIYAIKSLFEEFEGLKVVLDSGELVGAIKEKINEVLGEKIVYEGRGI
ncbi:phage tail protein [Enterococcus nangangensis]|uniref:phage tail protein n=1 Tax=Enterococcus nangangensis TaxID=2559926 RepID=UPI0010F777A8|nr:hypothetical protein [Enterococcus nangangensis]